MIHATQSAAFDRYELLSTLGEGGYGAVYEACDRTTGEHVALKELTQVNAASLAQFKHEFRALQEVNHPNLVRLEALFEDHGKWLIAMELVAGSSLLDHVYTSDNDSGFDEHQLRETFLQLADGLIALHSAGLLHRDLKPSNVRVTPEGRVVLLDFGLATALDPKGQSTRAAGLGTVAYMAPEQAASQKLGPAADWYAFGVCLFEALTGVLPIDAENPLALLLAKQTSIPVTASSQVPGIAEDLDRLCTALLAIAPEARPDGRAVRLVLACNAPQSSARPGSPSARPAGVAPFEGREQELGLLGQAFERVQGGAQQVMLVEGDSGIGKTALVERFLSSLQSQREILVLRSRCYENELLAYKAFDGAMDGLARILGKLDAAASQQLLPPNAALLCKLFPVLASIRALAKTPLRGIAADPGAQRLAAFSVFMRLLAKLSELRPIVLVIDDLQWADAESFRLLRAQLESPGPLRCLILATVRPRAELEGEAAEGIDDLRKLGCVTDLKLAGLPRAQAWALARELMGPTIPDSWLEIIVKESAGHPLFLTVLTWFAESHDPKTTAELTLDAAIAARIGGLSGKARKLLETVAVVGSPLAISLCGRAAEVGESELGRLVADLCRQKLLRRRRAGALACFHDHIRRVAVQSLPRAQTREIHARVARTLVSFGHADPAELARHYEAAGEAALALEAYGRAAEKALSSFAFARAAVLYARAIELSATLQLEPAQRTALKRERGHALARSGRSAEAARQYLDAAQGAEGEDKTRLRIWGVQHLLQSACVEEGMSAARSLLDELGVPLPSSTAGAIAHLTWDRAWVRLSGRKARPASGPIPLEARMQLDALWGLSMPLSWLDPLTSAALGTRYLRMALAQGDPTHLAQALADEAFARTIRNPGDSEADKLLVHARSLCDASKDPALDVSVSFREANVALFRWDQARSRERLEHALQVGTESCPDKPWLLTNVRTSLSGAWALMGDHALLAASCSAWLVEARDRNDQFALTMIEGIGFGTFRHLMADDPDQAQASLAAAMLPWPREPFSFAHYGELIAANYIERYRGGNGSSAWFQRELPRLSRAFLLKQGLCKATVLMSCSYGALAALDATGPNRAAQLREVRSHVRKLEAIKLPFATANVLCIRAQLAALGGELEEALDQARRLRIRSEDSGSLFLHHAIAYLEGQLEGGDAGRQRQQSALAFFADQGWKKPLRAVATLCPVIDKLEAKP